MVPLTDVCYRPDVAWYLDVMQPVHFVTNLNAVHDILDFERAQAQTQGSVHTAVWDSLWEGLATLHLVRSELPTDELQRTDTITLLNGLRSRPVLGVCARRSRLLAGHVQGMGTDCVRAGAPSEQFQCRTVGTLAQLCAVPRARLTAASLLLLSSVLSANSSDTAERVSSVWAALAQTTPERESTHLCSCCAGSFSPPGRGRVRSCSRLRGTCVRDAGLKRGVLNSPDRDETDGGKRAGQGGRGGRW